MNGEMPFARVKPLPVPLQRSRQAVGPLVGGAVIVVLMVAVVPFLRGPRFVPRLTLVNSTAYQVNVDATGASGGGWLDLGSVPREREVALSGIVDQGRTWTFRFSSAGIFAGEMTLSRSDLEHEGWRVNIPAGVAAPLQDAGLPPAAD